jgi:hypothetical protein
VVSLQFISGSWTSAYREGFLRCTGKFQMQDSPQFPDLDIQVIVHHDLESGRREETLVLRAVARTENLLD